jgi:hypothetical protein
MMMELATSYGVECKVGLTGFKWKMIKDFPEQEFMVVVKKVLDIW